MSDDANQEHESAPGNTTPFPQDAGSIVHSPAAQESFGSFPVQPEVTSAPSGYENPAFYNNIPPSYSAPLPYGTPPPYGAPPPYGTGYGIPPQGFYGQQFNAFQFPPERPPSTPLPLRTAIRELPRQYWRVFTHPKATTFIQEEGKAAWNIIWIQLLFLGIIDSIVLLVLVFLEFFLFQAILPDSLGSSLSEITFIVAVVTVLGCLAAVPISFFFGASIYYLIARAFGGTGTFLSHCYNFSLVIIPISIVSAAVSIIPCIGSLAASAGWVYEIVLLIFMTMGVHRLRGGRASATILIPIVTGIVLVGGAYIAYFVWLFSIMPHN